MQKLSSQQINLINGISEDYALLQKSYTKWASEFSKHEDVIPNLERQKIKVNGIQKQSKFNLHSYYWNGITIQIIKKLAECNLLNIKKNFDLLFDISKKEEQRAVWHRLFFIHPVRHELYYFDGHYPSGYAARLSKLLRSHRMGLKAAKKYLFGKSVEATEDSFIKACGTVALKHLLLHPTTSQWQFPDAELATVISTLAIGIGDLSPKETISANLLSQRGSLQFDHWLAYAPCAINEGPIFTSKTANPLECFDNIAELLSVKNVSQLKLRQCLQDNYTIKELII